MTSQLAHKYQNLVIEDLHVKGLMQGNTPRTERNLQRGDNPNMLTHEPAGSAIPSLTSTDVLREASQILMEEAGITNQDQAQLVHEDQTAASCPGLAVAASNSTHHASPDIQTMTEQVAQWRRKLAQDAVDRIDPRDKARTVQKLREEYSEPSPDRLRRLTLDTLRIALHTAGELDGHDRLTVIAPNSALRAYRELEIITGVTHHHALGERDQVPATLTLGELITHSAMVAGATKGERAKVLRELATDIAPPELIDQGGPLYAITYHCERERVTHDQAAQILHQSLERAQA